MLLGAIGALSVLIGVVAWLIAGGLWVLPVAALVAFLVLLGLAFGILMIMCKRVDQDVPQEEDDKFYRIVTNLIIQSALPVLQIHVKKYGLEKMPKEGRFLLVCNHCNDSDPIILLHCLTKYQLAFVSKKENRDMFVIGPMMHKIQCQLINRENDREALKTILNCIRIIKEDKASIAVFPEGGIKGGNVLHPFRSGVFKIALRTKVPVVVCTLWGTQDVFHNGLRLKPTDVQFHVLGVVQPEVYKDMTAVDLGHLVHDMMAKDLGPDRVLFVEENP